MLGDPELKKCKVGDIIQLQRRGFFKVDNAYAPASVHSGKISPVVLLEIPDGHQKTTTATTTPTTKVVPAAATNSKPSSSDLNDKIVKQGNIIRDLKAEKAEKSKIETEVKTLLALKAEFKAQTGTDWSPNLPAATNPPSNGDLNERIVQQGNLVRDLKAQKADKIKIDAAVKDLLALKAEYKAKEGKDWLPGAVAPATKPIAIASATPSSDLVDKIVKQGDLVRDLKTKKADKSQIDAEVKILLALKSEFKSQTGQDYKPGATMPAKPAEKSNDADINEKIVKQGNLVRDLKAQKAEKSTIDGAVKILLSLKAEYKTVTGNEWKPETAVKNKVY